MTTAASRRPPWATPDRHSASVDALARRNDVIVVGAGIVGLTTAVQLAEAGSSVVVLEARAPGAGTTGRSTAKATLLQGTRAAQLARARGSGLLAAYLAGNAAGLDLLRDLAEGSNGVGSAADAWTYATDRGGAEAVRAELAALTRAGVKAELAVPDELPFATTAAVRLTGQLRLDPGALVGRLLERLDELDVPVAWPVRARGIRMLGEDFVVHAESGQTPGDGDAEIRLRGQWVVLATLLPFPARTALFAAAAPQLSYALVGQPTTAPIPAGMYLSAGQPTRSLRSARAPDGRELLLVGGAGHPVGRDLPNSKHVAELASWAQEHYGLLDVEHGWAAHDYVSADLMPHVGPAPFGPDRLLVATGFGKWGMTNGAAAALALSGIVHGQAPTWAAPFAPRLAAGTMGWGRLATTNLQVGLGLVRGWVADPGGAQPAEGAGVVRRAVPHPRAVSMVDGVRRECSAVCPHLGGIVRWNDLDRTWDCPLHGSRFAPDGEVLTGPAVSPLAAAED